ncbi:hypothetical protein Poly41_29630 [Novipirellula artificiosorum]|uniref:Uncharacterized protein n=1 Tax=Novipirellula artificiosorum TaxID=2528016 RepID=A0A5C6DRK2_9BACT|nr:hypothetical protein Poly41_29630 [Novipirellula artificiosorum]
MVPKPSLAARTSLETSTFTNDPYTAGSVSPSVASNSAVDDGIMAASAQAGIDPVAQLEAEMQALDGVSDPSTPAFAWNQRYEPAKRQETTKPLTYEDLAVPLTRPGIVEERFNATASVFEKREQLAAAPRDGIAKMQPMGLTVSPPSVAVTSSEPSRDGGHEIGRVIPDSHSKPNAQLASASANPSATSATNASVANTDPILPVSKSPSPERERFWIRQPD